MTNQPEREDVPAAQRFPSADELRHYIGQWVMVIDGTVVASADTLSEALERLRKNGLNANYVDSVFRVPERPEEEL